MAQKQEAEGRERRESERVDMSVEVDVGLDSEHNFYTGLTRDISTGGLFVATHKLLAVGTKVRVRFTLPGQKEAIETDTEVRWLRDSRAMTTDAPEGMGLRFTGLSPPAKKVIGHFLNDRDSLFYDDE
jgi:uncharacterized protein (TIGR02266 family)